MDYNGSSNGETIKTFGADSAIANVLLQENGLGGRQGVGELKAHFPLAD